MSVLSKRLLASYVLDWLVIIVIAAAGGVLNFVHPYKRPFSLLDLSISFPHHAETISITTVGVVALVGPAVIIGFVALVFVPGFKYARQINRRRLIELKLWELERGLAGLALSVASAFFITQGLKNLFGKPRPNCIASCIPDLSNIAAHTLGGYGQPISDRWVLVDAGICTNPDTKLVDDAFRSFPSGHSSFSWAGMLYLSLFLCSKFAILIPHLPPGSLRSTNINERHELLPLHSDDAPPRPLDSSISHGSPKASARDLAASPPNHLVIVAFIPVGIALYICATRFFDFYHHGFDIISGSIIGITCAYTAFRWCHLPLGRGQGWAWGPRSKECAFGVGVGVGSYVEK